MTRPFVDTEFRELTAEMNDPLMQKQAAQIVRVLGKRFDLAGLVGLLVLAVNEAFMVVLHTESPMPEANIKMIYELIELLKTNTGHHEDCALHLTKALVAKDSDGSLRC